MPTPSDPPRAFRRRQPPLALGAAAAFLALLALPPALSAQQAEPAPRALWLSYVAEAPIAGRFGGTADVQTRFDGAFDELRQVLGRAGLTYDATPAVRVSGGYASAFGWAGTSFGTAHGREHRLWQMVQLAHGAGPVRLTHRARLEQRHIGTAAPDSANPEPALAWAWSQRARYQLRFTAPLAPRLTHGRADAAVSDELFAAVSDGVHPLTLTQNRMSVAVGYRTSPRLRFEASYINQVVVPGGGAPIERLHVLQLGVASRVLSRQ